MLMMVELFWLGSSVFQIKFSNKWVWEMLLCTLPPLIANFIRTEQLWKCLSLLQFPSQLLVDFLVIHSSQSLPSWFLSVFFLDQARGAVICINWAQLLNSSALQKGHAHLYITVAYLHDADSSYATVSVLDMSKNRYSGFRSLELASDLLRVLCIL